MREFDRSGSVTGMLRSPLVALVALTGCGSPTYQAWVDEQAQNADIADRPRARAAGATGRVVRGVARRVGAGRAVRTGAR